MTSVGRGREILPFPFMKEKPMFGGRTYDPELDRFRLTVQLARVQEAMTDGQWHTATDLERITSDEWASISARLRDLRKTKFGGHTVERRRQPGSLKKGIFEYRLLTFAADVV